LIGAGFPVYGEDDIKTCVAMLIMDRLVIAEGMSESHPIPPTGNTNTHVRFGEDVRSFLLRWAAEGPTHHAESLCQRAGCLGLEAVGVRG